MPQPPHDNLKSYKSPTTRKRRQQRPSNTHPEPTSRRKSLRSAGLAPAVNHSAKAHLMRCVSSLNLNLNPNAYKLYSMYQTQAHRTHHTRVKGAYHEAHRNSLGFQSLLGAGLHDRSPQRPHKDKDPTFLFQGPRQGGFQKEWLVGSSWTAK